MDENKANALKMIAAFGLFLVIVAVAMCWAVSYTHGDESSSQCTDAGHGLTVCKIQQPNGETITCVRTHGQGGGVSCDWND
ncbi:hypothetical protein [Pseudoscardovia suis]|uniref:Uncharacterized protein n=1 Tax=Pseudoscardovia suis TaxID=987063 RepID=A0A261EPT0_9BIFI|nr:hypothetical protein [Pseudoscardovia suis]OZG48860.1 hypothetical protein PSSU_1684 [Pseudoscardovia suis]PJJ63916.1 hypothetical protein CLV65_1539 [Pseudoscardovia suis]